MIENSIESLLDQYSKNRNELYKMIDELYELKENISKLFPEQKLDVRFARYFEEKVKAAIGLFGTILDIRKEVNKSISEEINLRRKDLSNNEIGEDDIRYLADKIEFFKKKKNTIKTTIQENVS